MSDELEPLGRVRDLRDGIRDLREKIEAHISTSTPEQVSIYLLMASIVSILNSEYGTIMRLLERQDFTNRRLFGDDKDDGTLIEKVDRLYRLFKNGRKILLAVLTALLVMAASKWYENVKLNEIIAQQKNQTTNQLMRP